MTRDLLLISLDGTSFGVWEEDITSVSPARPLHRLPLSPPVMAGLAVIDDHGVTVFDLGACLGAAPLTAADRSRFLLLKRKEQTFGLAVSGTIETVSIADDQVIELPRAVRTPVIDRGVVRGGVIVPIIEVRSLLDRLEQGVLSVPVPDGPVLKHASRREERDQLRVLSLGGERFCIEGAGTSWAGGEDLRVTRLTYLRGPVAGVVYHDGSVISVLASVGPVGGSDAASNASLFVVTLDGEHYGIVAGEDHGDVSGSELRPLPALARTAWSREAVMRDGEIILLLDLVKLLAPPAAEESLPSGDASYTPASEFSARFRQGSIEVIEFSLLGSLHALPKDEVKEVFPPVPFRRVPGLPEIVLGVAERGRNILPVLDLATIFGRRTAIGGQARMLRVANGDFHALVLVEEVLDDRILEREVQRQVPIALPHQVLYGCYLDDRAVRLIMNVYALAVHFERTEVRDLVASLAPVAPPVEESEERTAERERGAKVPEGTPASAAPAPGGEPTDPEGTPVSSATPPAGGIGSYGRRPVVPSSASSLRSPREEQQRQEAAEAAASEEAQRQEEEARRKREQEQEVAEAARRREEDAARAKAEEQAAAAARAEAERKAAEEERARAEAQARADAEERERAAAHERAAAEEREQQTREQERIRLEQQQQAAEQAARDEAKKRLEEAARAEAARQAEERAQRERERERERAAEEQERRRAEELLRQAAARAMHDRTQTAATNKAPRMSSQSQRPVRSRKALSIAAVVAAVLVLLLYWAGGPSKDDQPVREQAQGPKASAPAKAKVKEQEPEPPLVLDVPKAMPSPEVIVYVVVKGDTLWGISKRFTGNPFNYPRVAKDNSIATPDLIFPGQRIRLRHELQEQAEGKAKSP